MYVGYGKKDANVSKPIRILYAGPLIFKISVTMKKDSDW